MCHLFEQKNAHDVQHETAMMRQLLDQKSGYHPPNETDFEYLPKELDAAYALEALVLSVLQD